MANKEKPVSMKRKVMSFSVDFSVAQHLIMIREKGQSVSDFVNNLLKKHFFNNKDYFVYMRKQAILEANKYEYLAKCADEFEKENRSRGGYDGLVD